MAQVQEHNKKIIILEYRDTNDILTAGESIAPMSQDLEQLSLASTVRLSHFSISAQNRGSKDSLKQANDP
jgi:hypothetical protein